MCQAGGECTPVTPGDRHGDLPGEARDGRRAVMIAFRAGMDDHIRFKCVQLGMHSVWTMKTLGQINSSEGTSCPWVLERATNCLRRRLFSRQWSAGYGLTVCLEVLHELSWHAITLQLSLA